MSKIKYGDISRPSNISVINLGVPRALNSAPKKFEAATKNIIRTVISSAFIKLSKKLEKVNLRYPIANKIDPNAPIAAASAGVAKPSRIEPKAKEMRIVGGIKPAKNSSHRLEK